MKKSLKFLVLTLVLMLIGLFNVNAETNYWEDYFEKPFGITSRGGCSNESYAPGITQWENQDFYHEERALGGCGSGDSGMIFFAKIYSGGTLFVNIPNVTVKEVDANIITAEAKPYDFKAEKQNYEDFIKYYNAISLDEFYERAKMDFGDEIDLKTKYPTKPTWWEYYNDVYGQRNEDLLFESEPTTWWEAYGFESDPSNSSTEVLYYAHDLGTGSVTLSASGKEDIKINWTINVYDFNDENVPDAAGLAYILENYDKYKEIIKNENDNSYTYYTNKPSDVSSVINALKGKDITVCFENYLDEIAESYCLNGMDIETTVNEGFTYDHNISMETSINKEKIDDLMDYEDAIYIDFTYHGNLPTNYNLNVNISDYIENRYYEKYYDELKCESYYEKDFNEWDENHNVEYRECISQARSKAWEDKDKYINTTKFTLLYFNPETNKMEVIKEGLTADEFGEITLEFEHFSSYVLVEEGTYNAHNTPKPKAPNNADTASMNVSFYALLALVSIVGIGSIVFINRKKRKIVE